MGDGSEHGEEEEHRHHAHHDGLGDRGGRDHGGGRPWILPSGCRVHSRNGDRGLIALRAPADYIVVLAATRHMASPSGS